jgi:hypothetical protein
MTISVHFRAQYLEDGSSIETAVLIFTTPWTLSLTVLGAVLNCIYFLLVSVSSIETNELVMGLFFVFL